MEKIIAKKLIIVIFIILFIPAIGYIYLEINISQGILNEGRYISNNSLTEITNFYNNNGYCPSNKDIEMLPSYSKFFKYTLKINITTNICYIESVVADFSSPVRKNKIIFFAQLNPPNQLSLADWQCISDAVWIFRPKGCKSSKLPNTLFP